MAKIAKTTLLREMRNGLSVLRKFDRDFTVLQAQILLHLFDHESITVTEVEIEFDTSRAAASRAVRALTAWRKAGVAGHDLIDLLPDPLDFRVRRASLNAAGMSLVEEVLNA